MSEVPVLKIRSKGTAPIVSNLIIELDGEDITHCVKRVRLMPLDAGKRDDWITAEITFIVHPDIELPVGVRPLVEVYGVDANS